MSHTPGFDVGRVSTSSRRDRLERMIDLYGSKEDTGGYQLDGQHRLVRNIRPSASSESLRRIIGSPSRFNYRRMSFGRTPLPARFVVESRAISLHLYLGLYCEMKWGPWSVGSRCSVLFVKCVCGFVE